MSSGGCANRGACRQANRSLKLARRDVVATR
jgi:hypothetical protein